MTFTGIFIPASLWNLEDKKMDEKTLLALVANMDDGNGVRFSNAYITRVLNVSQPTASKMLSSFEEEGLIVMEEDDKGHRVIYVGETLNKIMFPNVKGKKCAGGVKDSFTIYNSNSINTITNSKKEEKAKAVSEKNERIAFYRNLISEQGFVYSSIDERKIELVSKDLLAFASEVGASSVRSLITDIVKAGMKDKWYAGRLCSIRGFAASWRNIANQMIADGSLKRRNAKEDEAKKRKLELLNSIS